MTSWCRRDEPGFNSRHAHSHGKKCSSRAIGSTAPRSFGGGYVVPRWSRYWTARQVSILSSSSLDAPETNRFESPLLARSRRASTRRNEKGVEVGRKSCARLAQEPSFFSETHSRIDQDVLPLFPVSGNTHTVERRLLQRVDRPERLRGRRRWRHRGGYAGRARHRVAGLWSTPPAAHERAGLCAAPAYPSSIDLVTRL